MLPVINAIWIGPKLGPMHAACLRSFVRHGYRTVLHVYVTPMDAPEGVELANAHKLLPVERLVKHRATGSVAIFADLLRCELLARGLGLYVDCDVFCLRPIEDEDHIYGLARPDLVGNCVLKLPPDSPALTDLRRMKDAEGWHDLPWLSWKRRAYGRFSKLRGRSTSLEDLPWGATGPIALTWCLKKHGLDGYAKPVDAFHSLMGREREVLSPDARLEDLITPRTTLLHLFHHLVQDDLSNVPPTSPLGVLMAG